MDTTEWLTAVIGIVLLLRFLERLIRRVRIQDEPKDLYILITGCDSGFGQDLAIKLDAMGFHVFACCLTEQGREMIQELTSGRVCTLRMDVSDLQSVRDAFRLVEKELPEHQGLWGLVNNAGTFGKLGPLDFLNKDDFQDVLNVNVMGVIDVTMTFMPLVKKARGRVVNISSALGRVVMPDTPTYVLSKFTLEAFTDILRVNLRPFGVSVHLLEPGLFRTNLTGTEAMLEEWDLMWNRAQPDVREEYGEAFYHLGKSRLAKCMEFAWSDRSPVIDAYVHALTSRFPRYRYTCGYDAYFCLFLSYLPTCLADLVMRIIGFGFLNDSSVIRLIRNRQSYLDSR